MEILSKKISEIKPYEKNPRKNEEAVDFVMQSIKEFGFKVPLVVDSEGIIVTGHTRFKAAKKLGMKEVPCIVASDLTDEQIRAYRLADNKVAEKAKWDNMLLDFELGEIEIDMTPFGFEFKFDEDEDEEPEMPFTEVLGEEHNFVVLYFDNEVDWLQAQTLLDIKPARQLSTRRDGVITESMKRTSVGRVFDGAEAIKRIRGEE